MDISAQGLGTPRQLVASLISALSTQSEAPREQANPLSHGASKELFLTLHVLFQNELLPALDLLDRGLITRLRLERPIEDLTWAQGAPQQQIMREVGAIKAIPGETEQQSATELDARSKAPCTYYVRSAQQQSSRSTSRFRNAAYEHTTYYEVRLDAWSCSCPAFAFSAFPATSADHRTASPEGTSPEDSLRWRFGGLTLGKDMPVCKHILACALVEQSSMFSHMVEERTVSEEEMAGWAAGWGD